MVVGGLAMFLTGPILGRWVRLMDPRYPLAFGFICAGYGFWLGHAVTPQWGYWELASLQAFRGSGIMIAMIASQNVTMATLPPELIKTASGLVNLSRNVGGAMGLAVLTTVLSTSTKLHMNELSSRMTVASQKGQEMLSGMAMKMTEMGVSDPAAASRKVLQSLLTRDAATLAYGDAFTALALCCFFAAFGALFVQPAPNLYSAQPVEDH